MSMLDNSMLSLVMIAETPLEFIEKLRARYAAVNSGVMVDLCARLSNVKEHKFKTIVA